MNSVGGYPQIIIIPPVFPLAPKRERKSVCPPRLHEDWEPFRGDGDVTAAGYARVPLHTVCTIALWAMIRAALFQPGLAPSTFHTSSRPLPPTLSSSDIGGPSVKVGLSMLPTNKSGDDRQQHYSPSTPQRAFLIRLPFRVFRAHLHTAMPCHAIIISRALVGIYEGRTLREGALSHPDTYVSLSPSVREAITCLGEGIQPLRFSWPGKKKSITVYVYVLSRAFERRRYPVGKPTLGAFQRCRALGFPCMTDRTSFL